MIDVITLISTRTTRFMPRVSNILIVYQKNVVMYDFSIIWLPKEKRTGIYRGKENRNSFFLMIETIKF